MKCTIWFFKYFYIIVSFWVVSTCTPDKNIKSVESYTLIEKSEKSFMLDSLSSALKSQVQIFPAVSQDTTNQILVFTNIHTNEILLFDMVSTQYKSKVKLMVDGPNGVGHLTGALYGKDSIYIHNYGQATLYLVNSFGEVLKKYSLVSKSDYKYPNMAECYPAFISGDYIHLNSWGAYDFYDKSQNFLDNLMLKVNIKNGEKSTYLKYPKLYQTAIWGVQLYSMYNSYNPTSKDQAFSFVADDSITVINSQGTIKRFFAGSKFIKSVRPYSTEAKLSVLPDIEKEVENQVLQGTYGQIWSDPYSGFTYRIAYKALTLDQFKKQTPQRGLQQDFSIIILNDSYDKVGEVDVPYNYSGFKVFFTKKGLYMLKSAFTEENKMIFGQFELIKK